MANALKRLKQLSLWDILAFFPMLAGVVGACFVRLRHPHLWLVAERKQEARDNGYWFFKYLCEQQTHVDAVYAIDPNGMDAYKVNKLGRTVAFGSIRHWAYYFAAEKNISSQKAGNPNAAICYILENVLHWNNHRYFLQHGITKDDAEWLYYKVCHFHLFACATQREYDFISQRFGYPKNNVQLLGFCRYDNLLMPHETKRQILVMPTWREWLADYSQEDFVQTAYFQGWNSLLRDESLQELLAREQYQLLFYPHANMQSYLQLFATSPNVVLCSGKEYDVQQLLRQAEVLVTDFSSVFFDFAYQLKPLIYYQFDVEEYRKRQYQEGYFSYEHDGFGPVVTTPQVVVDYLKDVLHSNAQMAPHYKEKALRFFTFHDTKNCLRTYQAIKNF